MESVYPHLRFEKLWLTLGWSLIIIVILLSLSPSPPSVIQSALFNDKLGHSIAYFVLMAWFAQIYHTPQQRLVYMTSFLLLGGLLEILQALSGETRQGDWADMLANSIGVLLAWQLIKNRFACLFVYLEKI